MASTSRTGRLLAALGLCVSACFAAQSHAQCVGYTINATGPGTFVPGVDDIGLHADDGTLAVALPFNVDFYGTSYSSVTASTNGNLQFVSAATAWTNNCLPTATLAGPAILPFWDDQYTTTTTVGQGIFTGTTGTAPNRVFVIEWRTQFCCAGTAPINDYEVKFYEGQSYFDIVYSTPMSDRFSATIGAQAGPNPTDAFVQYVCNNNPAGVTATAGLSLRFNCITAATSGACCNTLAGTCAISTTAACTGTGFQFRGLGTSCPSTCPANGACCNATTGACLLVGSAGCTGAGNTYSGDGTVCNPSPCPAPQNDDCSAVVTANTPRIPATGGTVSGTTLNATDDGGSGCGTGGHNDVYFLFTPSVSSAWTFALCGTNPAFDTVLSVHSGCPADASTQLAGGCNDDSCGPLSSITVAGLTANTQYIVRVSNYTAGNGGTFALAVTAAQLGACCSSATGACTSSTTGAAGCAAGTVYQGDNTSCTPIPCPIQACCNATTGVCTTAGTDPCPSGTTGQGTGTTCTPNPCPQPPPPANDDCAGAFPIVPNASPISGNNFNSTDSGAAHPCTGSTLDVWYTFTTTGAASFTATADSDTGNLISIVAYDGCGGNQLGCQAAVIDPATLTFTAPGAGTYFLRIATFTPATSYQLSLTSAILGACCNAANGACTTSTTGAAGCGAGTTYQGDNTSCTPSNPCPQPPTGACCDSTTGACTQVFAVNCNLSTSTYSGDNTTCDASGFCAGVGTCCSSLGNCVVRYTATCPSGLTSNTATTCTPTLCPATGPHICQAFDSDPVGGLPANWTSTTTGAGAAWVIDATQANSAPNSAFSNDVASVSSQFLQLPAVTAGGPLTIDFLSFYTTEATFDGWVLEFSTDGGSTWSDLVTNGTWVLNGYNQAAISVNFASPIAGRPAFSGAGAAWTEHIGTINTTAGSSVILRFQMASDSSVASTGVWLDDICIGGIQSTAGGVCCRGATCNTTVTSAAACTSSLIPGQTAGAAFVTTATACNTTGNTTSPCCYANYNKTGGISVQDIFDFLNDWFAGSVYANTGGTGNAGPLAVQNIFDFLNAWFAGGCS